MIKPSDFSLGVIDFLAVLVPGAAVVWLAAQHLPANIACTIDVGLIDARCAGLTRPELSLRWAVFALAAYVLGHFVFMLGSGLDGPYDRWRKRNKPLEADRAFEAAKGLVAAVTPQLAPQGGNSFSVLKWTTNYLRVQCPEAHLEVERLEATQKLFRSLVVVSGAVSAHFILAAQSLWLGLLAIAFGVLSFERFCDQRWKMTELSYAAAVIVHATKSQPAQGKGSE